MYPWSLLCVQMLSIWELLLLKYSKCFLHTAYGGVVRQHNMSAALYQHPNHGWEKCWNPNFFEIPIATLYSWVWAIQTTDSLYTERESLQHISTMKLSCMSPRQCMAGSRRAWRHLHCKNRPFRVKQVKHFLAKAFVSLIVAYSGLRACDSLV